jgi:hypothetical protein
MMIHGARIIENRNMVDYVDDWSRVRSPSRALRRRRQGHKQNIDIKVVPKKEALSMEGGRVLIMHPDIARALRSGPFE